jgi:outer membrane protein TolC
MSKIPALKAHYLLAILALLLIGAPSKAQTALDSYVTEAFANNKVLKQQAFQLDKSLQALKEAQSYFLPNVSLLGSYVKSKGGRTIDLPIGDLFNPVYSSLNTLTESNSFPQIGNESIQLNPDNFYDLKFRTSMPLINSEIWINRKIKKELISFQQATLNVYKRQLVRDVKAAYYQILQADQAVAIYTNALALVKENVRVNESLFRNGVRNATALTRATAEKEKIEAAINEAVNNRTNARAYFNFLLNRSLDAPVVLDSQLTKEAALQAVTNSDVSGREELHQIRIELSANNLSRKLQQSYLIPKLNTFLDLGSQAAGFRVDNKSQYYLLGLNLQWDLFAGGQHTYKARQAKLDVQATELKLEQAQDALTMQLVQIRNNYNSAGAKYRSARTQLALAGKYYHDQLKVYKEGQLLYIELLDAQNQITQAALEQSIALTNVLIAGAELERCQAAYPLQ